MATTVLFPVGTRCWGTEVTSGGATDVQIDFDSFENGAAVLPMPEGRRTWRSP